MLARTKSLMCICLRVLCLHCCVVSPPGIHVLCPWGTWEGVGWAVLGTDLIFRVPRPRALSALMPQPRKCGMKLAPQRAVPVPRNLEGVEFAHGARFAFFPLGGRDSGGSLPLPPPPPPRFSRASVPRRRPRGSCPLRWSLSGP